MLSGKNRSKVFCDMYIYIYIYCACSCVPILILYSNCFQKFFFKISLYLVMFIFLSGANVCSARDLRPAVLLRRYHHCIEFDFWCHYRHFCRFEEWETTKGRDSQEYLFHLRYCPPPMTNWNYSADEFLLIYIYPWSIFFYFRSWPVTVR